MTSNLNFRRIVKTLLMLVAVTAVVLTLYVFNARLDAEALTGANRVLPHEPYRISEDAQQLHDSLRIADWHVDSLMWLRDLLIRSDIGQVDIPRLNEGNLAVQVFTSVTRVPSAGIQGQDNPGQGDKIANLAFMDKWPKAARKSLLHRALFHAEKLLDLERRAPESVKVILNQSDLAHVLNARELDSQLLGAVLGTEGLHPLEGKIQNVSRLFDSGYRIMGLFHFFDNELGSSLHGTSHGGLSDFGRRVVAELNQRNIIIDVAHASPASVREILAISDKPVILSHTGMRARCDSQRNIPDELMLEIVRRGGLIGIGYVEITICEMTPESIVDHLRYAVDLLGMDHVSLGSDYDGSVEAPFDVSEVAVLTQTMLERGFSEAEIRAIMGENIIRFLSNYLPE